LQAKRRSRPSEAPCRSTPESGSTNSASGLAAGLNGLITRIIFLLTMALALAAPPVLRAQSIPSGIPLPGGAAGRGADSPNIARGVHLVAEKAGEGAGIVVDLDRETGARFEVLDNPARLVIDLDGVIFPGAAAGSAKAVGPVSAWRAGLFLMGQSRIVLDLAEPALIDRIDFVRQAGTARLVASIRTVPQAEFSARAEVDRAKRLTLRQPEEAAGERKAGAKPLLVIDPGHGGIDPGASGPRGEAEKDIVLAMAQALKTAIEADGRIEVQLTRNDDRFLALGERVAFGRSRGAALFVSLHADSLFGEREVRGASVYTLSDRASDANAARAAEKENRADLTAGLDAGEDKREGVDDILFDLARRETRLFSQIAARNSASAISKGARLHKTPLRSAGFRVLTAPDMPSILVELGYLSNAEDLAQLQNAAVRTKLAAELSKALTEFILSGRDAVAAKLPQSQP
jgi:N-acetylmuramoyl-L-alanine amidase